MITDFDREHVQEILVNKDGRFDWYSCHVIRTVAKADRANREVMRAAYPEHVAAYERWLFSSTDGRTLR
jgi:hypothetical protein